MHGFNALNVNNLEKVTAHACVFVVVDEDTPVEVVADVDF
jgi:hypothetical protein